MIGEWALYLECKSSRPALTPQYLSLQVPKRQPLLLWSGTTGASLSCRGGRCPLSQRHPSMMGSPMHQKHPRREMRSLPWLPAV